jgi:hypothetical protein
MLKGLPSGLDVRGEPASLRGLGQDWSSTDESLNYLSSDDTLNYSWSDDTLNSTLHTWTPQAPASDAAANAFGGGSAVVPVANSTLASVISADNVPSVTYQTVGGEGGSGGGLVFSNTYVGVSAQYKACIVAAESLLSSLFTNSLTLNVTFTTFDDDSSGFVATNTFGGWTDVSYSRLKGALPTSDVLPASDPIPGGSGDDWSLPEAYARMLGLNKSTPAVDDTVKLNLAVNWKYGQDVINALTHEISEGGMGRVGGLGDQNSRWSTMDLFRYTSSGSPDYTDGRDGQTTYFSSDGGAILSNQGLPQKGAPTLTFNNEYNSSGTKVNKGDTADVTGAHVFGGTGAGETLALTQGELDIMEALGWKVNLEQDIVTANGAVNWETPTAWSIGCMPIEPMDAAIGGLNTVNVTLSDDVIVNSIAVNAVSTLTIASGDKLTAVHGTVLNTDDSYSLYTGNLGLLDIDPDATLLVGPDLLGTTFYNSGTMNVGFNQGGGGTGYLNFGTGDQLTLQGGGAVALGSFASQTFSTGDITGDDLIDVNNTISGGGAITVTALDNQANGKIEASQSEGDDLALNVSGAFSNEGELNVEGRAAMDLGSGGAVRSLVNTGSINLGYDGSNDGLAGAHLVISGNFSISGNGEINFKGAGAAIISDDSGSDTFTNKSSIDAFASGQIGDNGIYGGTENHLTFVNQGSVYANGSGVTLTLNTGGDTIADGGGTYLLEAKDDATLAIDSATTTGEIYLPQLGVAPPTAGTIESTSGGTVDIAASVTAGISATLPLLSAPGQVVVDTGSSVVVQSGGSVAIPIDVNGSSGKTAGGVLTLQSGGAITGTITLKGSGGAFDDNASSATIGNLNVGAGASVSVAANDTLTVTGAATLAGRVSGAGTLTTSGGTATVSAAPTVASWTSANETITTTAAMTYTGKFTAGAGDVLNATGGVLALKGANSFAGGAITGSQRVQLLGGANVTGAETFGGSQGVSNLSTLAESGSGAITLGDSSGAAVSFINSSTGVLKIANNNGVALGNAAASRISNSGLIEKTAGIGLSTIAASVSGAGTISVQTGVLDLAGASNTLSGLITGAGKIDFSGASTTLSAGFSANVANMSIFGAGTTVRLLTNLSYGGGFTLAGGASMLSTGSTLTLTGTSSLGGTIYGLASLALIGGAATVTATATINSTTWTSTGTALTFNGGHTYSGSFGASTETMTMGGLLILAGGASLTGLTINGNNQLRFTHAATIAGGLTLGGTTNVANYAAVSQSGGNVVLGDSSGGVTKIINSGSATTWAFTDDSGIVRGNAAASSINNNGIIEKSGGTGVSEIGATIVNGAGGKLEALSGTLDLQGAITGGGSDVVSGASTLEFDSSVASTQTALFQGTDSVLDLTNWAEFSGVLSGFDSSGASNDTIDVSGPWSWVGFNQNTGMMTFADGATQHSVKLLGSYIAGNFHEQVVSGVTHVTYG